MSEERGRSVFFLIISSLFLLLLISPSVTGSWNQWRGDPLHHAITEGPGPEKGELIWSYQTNGQVYSSPSFYEGGMLIGSDDGNMYCFDPDSGDVRWKFRTDGEVQSTAYIDGRRAYFGSFDRNLYCIGMPGPEGGIPDLEWNYSTKGRVIGSPTPYLDSVIVADNEGYIYRIDKEGDLVWENRISDIEFWSSPVVDAGTGRGIIGNIGNGLFVFDLENGRNLIQTGYGPDSEIYSSAILKEGIYYFPDGEGRTLIAEDLDERGVEWVFDIGYPSYSTPVIDDDRIYFSSFEFMWCLPLKDPDGSGNITEDEVIWSSPTHDFQGGSSPVVVEDRVYVGSDDYKLYCFDKMTGEEIWTFETRGYVYSSPSLHNGSIYFGSLDRSVYCIGDRPPGLVVEATLSPREINSDGTAQLLVNITDEKGIPVNGSTLILDTSAGYISTPDGEELLSLEVGGGSAYLSVVPIRVSSRSTMDIHLIARKEGLREGSATVQLIVEPGEGDPADEIEVSSTTNRTPYFMGAVMVFAINILLFSIIVLFKVRDINTRKEVGK